ncbi:CBL-interacting protein kinase 5 [Platysternon megacephalum]|uniref:CBL-interacting protein kinase 5 n=1 Tax=Platysternon megacephalum TaxID=55544 RepID=A0A4D9DG88_9SAUR|nr:CBL-interacting protein kinase 5 [Platysternon megacephalum]
MVGAAYAAVPFYNWFCRVTGLNGTPQIATAAPSGILAREVAVRFDLNIAPGLSWKGEPDDTEMTVKIGDIITTAYRITNVSDRTVTAQAAYNVTPLTAGGYFQKINCFCFTDQTLAPGETREMPVVFYVDPALDRDAEFDGLNAITLSYTFYETPTSKLRPLAARSDPTIARP